MVMNDELERTEKKLVMANSKVLQKLLEGTEEKTDNSGLPVL
jgi:hypothetical protein